MKTSKFFLTLMVAGVGLATTLSGCTGSAGIASAPAASLTTSTTPASEALAQRVAVDRQALTSRIEAVLKARDSQTAQFTVADGRTFQVPTALLPADATLGKICVLTVTLSDQSAPAVIGSLDPGGQATIQTAQGAIALPASLLPSQARWQGNVQVQLVDNVRALDLSSINTFDAQIVTIAATITLQGANGSFQVPASMIKATNVQTGDTIRVTITSTNEPDTDLSGTISSRTNGGMLILALTAPPAPTGSQVQLPSAYAPSATQVGDFFRLTMIKVTFQQGNLF